MTKHRRRLSFSPSFVFQAVAVFVFGSLLGVGFYTFIYAQGFSYFGSDPKTCINCHAMNPQYEAWTKGSHHNVATCNDCHTPHDNIVHKYYVKAEDGFLHGWKFTTGNYPENIEIRPKNREITNEACLHCHSDLTAEMHVSAGDEQIQCTHCHRDVGHKSR